MQAEEANTQESSSSNAKKKDRKRHDQHISAFFRKIRAIPCQMIKAFGQRSYYKPDDLAKNMTCFSEIFNRIFCPIFKINRDKIYEAFLDFIVLKQVEDKATKILNLFLEEGLVSEAYAQKFKKMLKLRKKPSKTNFIYFYRNNMCFKAITIWALTQINRNMPYLRFNSFSNDLVQCL